MLKKCLKVRYIDFANDYDPKKIESHPVAETCAKFSIYGANVEEPPSTLLYDQAILPFDCAPTILVRLEFEICAFVTKNELNEI